MVTAVIYLVCGAALLGLFMLYYLLADKPVPKGLAFVHGPLAAAGLILLAVYALTTTEHHKHYESLVLFSVAAVGGVVLFYKDITGRKIPKWLGVVHAVLALAGIASILLHTLGDSHS